MLAIATLIGCDCPNGQTRCNPTFPGQILGACTDIARDVSNCGSCGAKCVLGKETCVAGKCVACTVSCEAPKVLNKLACSCECPTNWKACGDTCCGGSDTCCDGKSCCPSSGCQNGRCCRSGVFCGDVCCTAGICCGPTVGCSDATGQCFQGNCPIGSHTCGTNIVDGCCPQGKACCGSFCCATDAQCVDQVCRYTDPNFRRSPNPLPAPSTEKIPQLKR
jgi:hypothetical protein